MQVVHFFLFIGTLHALYAILQYFDLFAPMIINRWPGMASGVAGNPNFMGSLLVMQIGLTSGLFYYAQKLSMRLVYLILTVLFLGTVLLTKTMSALFGIAILALFFFSYLLITRKKKREIKGKYTLSSKLLILGLIGIIIALIVFNMITDGYLLNEIIEIYYEITHMAGTGQINESFGTGRFIVWKNVLSLIPQYFMFGCGIDTFAIAYHSIFPPNMGQVFDKAHNEYLQIALTQGVPALITYMSLLSYVGYRAYLRFQAIYYNESRENKYENLYLGLFLAICGYLAQALFNISVIDVAPFFWMLLGLLAGNDSKIIRKKSLGRMIQVMTEEGVKEIDEAIYIEQ